MFRSDLYGSIPGYTAASETYERSFRWGRDYHGLIMGAQISGAARDAGNTPPTVLRPGLVLGQIASNGLLKEYNPTGVDGSERVYGILLSSFRMQDLDANNINRFVWILAAGPVKAANLLLLDGQARNQMGGRYIFDDDLGNKYESLAWTREQAKTANYTVLVSDVGTLFTTTGNAAPITFTLPALAIGLGPFDFLNTVDQNMIVAAPAGKLITFNNAAATSVAFQTASNKIGGRARFWCNVAGTFYYMENLSPGNTITVA